MTKWQLVFRLLKVRGNPEIKVFAETGLTATNVEDIIQAKTTTSGRIVSDDDDEDWYDVEEDECLVIYGY